jgi:hypothetical protein
VRGRPGDEASEEAGGCRTFAGTPTTCSLKCTTVVQARSLPLLSKERTTVFALLQRLQNPVEAFCMDAGKHVCCFLICTCSFWQAPSLVMAGLPITPCCVFFFCSQLDTVLTGCNDCQFPWSLINCPCHGIQQKLRALLHSFSVGGTEYNTC